MKRIHHFALSASAVALIAALGVPLQTEAAQELPRNITVSTDAGTSADQRLVCGVVHRYEELLNAGNTQAIVDLFAADGVG